MEKSGLQNTSRVILDFEQLSKEMGGRMEIKNGLFEFYKGNVSDMGNPSLCSYVGKQYYIEQFKKIVTCSGGQYNVVRSQARRQNEVWDYKRNLEVDDIKEQKTETFPALSGRAVRGISF